jgi:deoxyribodipyrimidine photo-lyase
MRAVHWFRNDLRLHDNTALNAALARADELVPVFVFDDHLLAAIHRSPPRTRFLLDCVARLAADLARRGCPLVVRRGDPVDEIPRLLSETGAELLTFNRDYSPYAKRRDARVRARARGVGAAAEDHKDRVVFEDGELRTQAGRGFLVYTPFRNRWIARYRAEPPPPLRLRRLPKPVPGIASEPLPGTGMLGADGDATVLPTGGEVAARARLARFLAGAVRHYARDRDRPAVDGTSRLSPYLRFGAVSPRQCVHDALALARCEPRAAAGARKWIDELVWREFYIALLDAHPHVLRHAFRPEFDRLRWNDDPAALRAWRAGRTGYPFVDAAMRQLVQTGWVHNRARMIVASFLSKDLLLDWRLGEGVFMRHLIDGEPASNNGGWQWSASTGTDAQPYFRIFNPVLQGERFDPGGDYVRRYVPEVRGVPTRFVHRPWEALSPPRDYPPPIVDHAERRVLAVARYEAARAERRGAKR